MKCLVSSPGGASLDTLTGLLRSMGVDVVDVRSALLSSAWSDWIRDEIAASDMVLVVLPAKQPDPPAFLIEIGMALGLAKPIMILAPEERPLPSDLAGLQYVRASPDDSQALELHLRALVESSATPGLRSRSNRRVPAQPAIAAWLAQSLQQLAASPALSPQEQARSLEALVVELFRRAGGFVETAEAIAGSRPDLAVLFDQFPAFGGPLLVDVKLHQQPRPPDRAALLQLQQYVLERGASLGVLVYWSPAGRLPTPTGSFPLLIQVDLTALPEELETRSLPDVLATERNRAVHGV